MLICSKCGLEMECVKTGRDVQFVESQQIYSGDEYECPFCEARIINCNSAPRSGDPAEGCLEIFRTTTKEKVLEEGDCGEVIGIFIFSQKMGRPDEKLIRDVLDRDYPGCSIKSLCKETKPGIWLIGSYVVTNED